MENETQETESTTSAPVDQPSKEIIAEDSRSSADQPDADSVKGIH